jgi:hypothetical protein
MTVGEITLSCRCVNGRRGLGINLTLLQISENPSDEQRGVFFLCLSSYPQTPGYIHSHKIVSPLKSQSQTLGAQLTNVAEDSQIAPKYSCR